MKISTVAAIDIGSNAIRLLVNYVIEETGRNPVFRKAGLYRLPVRLGGEVFHSGFISESNANKLCQAIQAYKNIMDVYEVDNYIGFATSAMRDARNGNEIIERIKSETGIIINTISGREEAEIICNHHLETAAKYNGRDQSFLYVDVGGGSTEYSFFIGEELIDAKSFQLGTVRILNDTVKSGVWESAEKWVKFINEKTDGKVVVVGSGGNINKLYRIAYLPQYEPIPIKFIQDYLGILNKHTINERIILLDLKPDRADVIVHALNIYIKSMNWVDAEFIEIPKMGLTDGIIRRAYAQSK